MLRTRALTIQAVGMATAEIERWVAHGDTPMRVSFVLIVALLAGQASLANDVMDSHVAIFRADDNCVIDNKTTVRCDHLADRLRVAHVRSDAWISLFIDNAKYETVVKTLNSLRKAGFTGVDVFPPINGTNLSSTVTRWIRLRVEGVPNHPFAMLLISTERFETWREELLVLSATRYDVIDRFTQARMAQPDCKSFEDFRAVPRGDNTISISAHEEDRSQACVIPTAESCDFLSELLNLSEVNLAEAEIQPVKHVKGELSCKGNPKHSQ
jgi:hypothetical protein